MCEVANHLSSRNGDPQSASSLLRFHLPTITPTVMRHGSFPEAEPSRKAATTGHTNSVGGVTSAHPGELDLHVPREEKPGDVLRKEVLGAWYNGADKLGLGEGSWGDLVLRVTGSDFL